MHHYRTEQFLPISIQEAWDFFSNPGNLEKITPKDMDFVVLTELDDGPIYTGMEIEYTVRPMFGIPVKWKTLISDVKDYQQFTDKQLKGPYSVWEHTHTFEEMNGGVLMRDHIKYKLPMGPLGAIAHKLFVKKRIEQIFDYRYVILKEMFKKETVHAG